MKKNKFSPFQGELTDYTLVSLKIKAQIQLKAELLHFSIYPGY